MSYEYFLVPSQGSHFSDEVLSAMAAYLAELPTQRWEDGSFILFTDEEQRARHWPKLLAERPRNDYLHAFVALSPSEVTISSVADNITDRYLYNFIRFCQERRPCQLHYGGQVISPEVLLPDEEPVPSLD